MTTFEIVQTIIGGGLGVAILRMTFIMGKISQKIDNLGQDIKDIKLDINNIKRDISSIESRLSWLEGAFFGPKHWESRKTGTDEKK